MINDGLKIGHSEHDGLQIEVLNMIEAQKYLPGKDEVCISITAPEGDWLACPPAKLSNNFKEILRLVFTDTLDDPYIAYRFDEGISDIQAQELSDFVMKNKDRKKLIIHCRAGVSRSRSIAAAICHVLDLPYLFTVLNTLAYEKVCKALEEQRNESQKKTAKK